MSSFRLLGFDEEQRGLLQPTAMSALGGGELTPPPSFSTEDAFCNLIAMLGKKKDGPSDPKFIKKLETIPEIDLLEEKPMKISLELAERGLVG